MGFVLLALLVALAFLAPRFGSDTRESFGWRWTEDERSRSDYERRLV